MRGNCMPVRCLYFAAMDEDGEFGELTEMSGEIEVFGGSIDDVEATNAYIAIPSTKTFTLSGTWDVDAYLLSTFGTNNSRRFKGLPLRRGVMNWRRWRKK